MQLTVLFFCEPGVDDSSLHRTLRKLLACGLFLVGLGVQPLPCTAVTPELVATALTADTTVLRVFLNTEDKGDFFVGITPGLDYLIKVADLRTMGFKAPDGMSSVLDGELHIALKSMRGVSFEFDTRQSALKITADPQLLAGQALALKRDDLIRGAVLQDSSAFLNYALTSTQSGFTSGNQLGVAAELGIRWGDFLLLGSGNTAADINNQRRFIRLQTSVTTDDRDTLQRVVFGDFFTPALEFGNGVGLGGLSISKLYGLNPYFTRFPTKRINGVVATPSDLEVFLDGQRIRSERIRPGEFELRDLVAYGGARNVQVQVRDAFGRVQRLDYSLYFSDQALQRGLQEYSYNVGALRRNFGQESNNYGPLALSAFHRYGFTDAITAGLQAEASKDFYNVGPQATLALGNAGIINAALSVSTLRARRGMAALMSYSYQAPLFSLGVSVRRDWGTFASLGDPITVSNRKYEASIAASYSLNRFGSVSIAYSVLAARDGFATPDADPLQPVNAALLGNRRVTSLGYSVPLVSGRASLQASLSHVNDGNSRNEAFVGVIYFLDQDYSLASSLRGTRTDHTEQLQFTKNQPVGEGLGYIANASNATGNLGGGAQASGRIQYNAPAFIVQGDLGQRRGSGQTVTDSRVSVSGGVALVGGQLAMGRPVTESFGLVKVGELEGVAVAVNGQPVGRTDANGTVFIPSLTPYYDTDITIAPETVPIDFAIPSTLKRVSPSLRSGAVIDFGVTRIQAFSGRLLDGRGGKPEPLEFNEIRLETPGRPLSLQTGRGGEFYIENLKPGRYAASVVGGTKPCRFDITIDATPETFVELGQFVCQASGPEGQSSR